MPQELLGNNSQSIKKRVQERSVSDALHRVREWRRIYEQGKGKLNTNQPRISLQEAANLVKIPKKTLEDYTYIFNKVSSICRIEDFSNKRMRFLRGLIEKNKAQIKAAVKLEKKRKKNVLKLKKKIHLKIKQSLNLKMNLTSIIEKTRIQKQIQIRKLSRKLKKRNKNIVSKINLQLRPNFEYSLFILYVFYNISTYILNIILNEQKYIYKQI
ncbi:unnamed protein product [Paramecium sonneborni]|uniref:Uncharacterized protein n=1 Tax=Paramecium sonneborni TaxID=65129 RepID=A0A8S1RV60_9CILI|nr:unnamed protein product [Paramecium sonneborni]